MRIFSRSLKGVLAIGFTVLLACACWGLFFAFDIQSRKSAISAAQSTQMMSLRMLVDKFAQRFEGLEMTLSPDGGVDHVEWAELVVPQGHDLIDEVGQLTGETATLFAWVPGEGDFIRRTTNIVKPDGSRAVGTWLGKENPVHAAMMRGETYTGEAVILGKPYYTIYEPILNANNDVVGIFYVGVDRSVVDAQISERLMLGIKATLLVMGIGVGLMMLLLNRAMRPLREITVRLKSMADGDLDTEVPHTDRPDGVGTTAQIVDGFRAKLCEANANEASKEQAQKEQARVVSALRTGLAGIVERNLATRIEGTAFPPEYEALRSDFDAGIDSLAQALQEAESVSHGVHVAASQIGATSDNLAQRVEVQSKTLVDAAEALNGLTATGRDIAQDVGEADRLANTSRQLSDESGEVVRQTISAINRIEETSEKINQIITAIDDIAFQTNLLALNAGVEAARAGAAGKGFAVVASEVRTLAQTAATSAQEIKTLILASGDEVREGAELVQKTGSSLGLMQEQVEKLGGLIGSISEQVRGQTDGLGEINESVQDLEGTTKENAAIVEELSASGHRLNSESERLAQTLGVFDLGAKPQLHRTPDMPLTGAQPTDEWVVPPSKDEPEQDDLQITVDDQPIAVGAEPVQPPPQVAARPSSASSSVSQEGVWNDF